ncbi:MAG: hypothetical protein WB791_02640 [Waddliaceae bacterium]
MCLAKKIFYFSPDLQISVRAARLLCRNPHAIKLVERLAQLDILACHHDKTAVNQELLEIARLVADYKESMEQIPWSFQHLWWNAIEDRLSGKQRSLITILRHILDGEGRKQPKTVRGAAGLCLFTFFKLSNKDWKDPKQLERVQEQLQNDKENPELDFVQALGPVFFLEAANIVCLGGQAGKTYIEALQCLSLAGGLNNGPRAFEFILRIVRLVEYESFGELYFMLHQAFAEGNVLLPKDPIKARRYLRKSSDLDYKPAIRLWKSSDQIVPQQCVQHQEDVREENRLWKCVRHPDFGVGWIESVPNERGEVYVAFGSPDRSRQVPEGILTPIPNDWTGNTGNAIPPLPQEASEEEKK